MSDPITAAAIGAGVGGGTSLLRGKSLGSALQNAAIGGALGGAGGYLGGAMGGAGGSTSTGANLVDDAAQLSGVTAEKLVFNPATGNFINPAYFAGASSSMPLYTGAGSTLSQIGTGLGSLGSKISNVMPGDVLMSNPLGYGNLALQTYGAMNPSQAPLQPSPMQSAQQLIGNQSPVPTPQFNSLLQPSRRPILIG
jgi:hypothetical protein